jgi:hypothetical protein
VVQKGISGQFFQMRLVLYECLGIEVAMSVVVDDEKYDEISEKIKKRLKYERLADYNALLFILYALIPTLVSFPFVIWQNIQLGSNGSLLLAFCGVLLAAGIITFTRRKMKTFFVDDNEWAIYYARPLYINLAKCLKEKTEGMKEHYRNKTVQYAENLLTCVQERWTVGTFKPIREFENGAVSAFKKNLRYRIIPSIEEGDDALLEKVEGIMFNFLNYAQTLHIDEIKKLNEEIYAKETGLINHEPSKQGYISRFLGFMRPNRLHVVVLGTIGIVSIIVLYGLLVWGLSKESAVSDTLILLGILISAYVAIQWNSKR